jgi:hypothetical protein
MTVALSGSRDINGIRKIFERLLNSDVTTIFLLLDLTNNHNESTFTMVMAFRSLNSQNTLESLLHLDWFLAWFISLRQLLHVLSSRISREGFFGYTPRIEDNVSPMDQFDCSLILIHA